MREENSELRGNTKLREDLGQRALDRHAESVKRRKSRHKNEARRHKKY